MAKKKSSKEITIRIPATEYLTFVSAISDQPQIALLIRKSD